MPLGTVAGCGAAEHKPGAALAVATAWWSLHAAPMAFRSGGVLMDGFSSV